jgi:hypothetical protein
MRLVDSTPNTRVLKELAELLQESREQEQHQSEEYGTREEQHC